MYSHDQTVEAVRTFYQQLVKLTHPDESWLRIPPAQGWDSTVMEQSYEALDDKTVTVKRLLRHLPYLRTEPYGRANMISDILLTWETVAICYAVEPGIYTDQPGYPDGLYPLPPHCVYLTRGTDREGTHLVLDTERGTVTESNVHGTCGCQPTVPWEEYEKIPEAEKWKAFPTAPVHEFFERWTRNYTKLIWMIIPDPKGERAPKTGRYYSRAYFPDEERRLADAASDLQEWIPDVSSSPEYRARLGLHTAAVYNTHLRHGWPSDFNKGECKAALLELEKVYDEEQERVIEEASSEAGNI